VGRASKRLGKNLSQLIIPEMHRAAHKSGLGALFCRQGKAPVLGRRIEIEALRRDGKRDQGPN